MRLNGWALILLQQRTSRESADRNYSTPLGRRDGVRAQQERPRESADRNAVMRVVGAQCHVLFSSARTSRESADRNKKQTN